MPLPRPAALQTIATVAVVLALAYFAPQIFQHPADPVPTAPATPPAPKTNADANRDRTVSRPDVGFRSRAALQEHFQKHGREFGQGTTIDAYLQRAQTLRDAPASGPILEHKRADGVTTRFDRRTGDFVAFNPDATLRTFFRPTDGEPYFHRQLQRADD